MRTNTPPGGVLRDANGNEVTDLAYVRIAEFNQRTPQEVEPLVREAEESGMRGLILDLRVNPGGLLKETVDTTDLFLDEGVILTEVDRFDQQTVHRAHAGGAALEIPIVVLLDGHGSAPVPRATEWRRRARPPRLPEGRASDRWPGRSGCLRARRTLSRTGRVSPPHPA